MIRYINRGKGKEKISSISNKKNVVRKLTSFFYYTSVVSNYHLHKFNQGQYCLFYSFDLVMAMTNAERMKKYREKIKKDKVKYEAVKVKARIRNNSIRTKLTGASLEQFLAKNRPRQKNFRENKKSTVN